MLFGSLLNRGALPVLEQVTVFTEARHEVLVDNIANIDTVGYKMRDLPADEFNQALDKAVQRRDRSGVGAALTPRDSKHYRWNDDGSFEAQSGLIEDNNILFHDENNRMVEKQMSDLNRNALQHNIASEMLRQQYDLLRTAIVGKL